MVLSPGGRGHRKGQRGMGIFSSRQRVISRRRASQWLAGFSSRAPQSVGCLRSSHSLGTGLFRTEYCLYPQWRVFCQYPPLTTVIRFSRLTTMPCPKRIFSWAVIITGSALNATYATADRLAPHSHRRLPDSGVRFSAPSGPPWIEFQKMHAPRDGVASMMVELTQNSHYVLRQPHAYHTPPLDTPWKDPQLLTLSASVSVLFRCRPSRDQLPYQ